MKIQYGNSEYEIDANNTVSIWFLDSLNNDVEGCPPNIRQPQHPDGTPFADFNAAKFWVENFLTQRKVALEQAQLEAQTQEAQEENI